MELGMTALPDIERSAALCRRLALRFIELDASRTYDIAQLLELKRRCGIYYTLRLSADGDMSRTPELAEALGISLVVPAAEGQDYLRLSRVGEAGTESLLRLARDRGGRVVLDCGDEAELERGAMWVHHWLNRSSDPDELWDVYDSGRRLKGRLHRRGELLAAGDFHLVVHVWMKNSRGEFLLTKRAPEKGCGGMWESPGGSAKAGEDSLTAALREIREETGLTLTPSRGAVFRTFSKDHFICDIWLFRQDFDLRDAALLPGETTDIMYAGPERIRELYESGDFVPFEYLDELLGME